MISLGWDFFLIYRARINKYSHAVYTIALIIPDEAHGLAKWSYGDDAPQNDTGLACPIMAAQPEVAYRAIEFGDGCGGEKCLDMPAASSPT